MEEKKNFSDFIVSIIDWVQEHKDTVISIGIVILVVSGFLIYFLVNTSNLRKVTQEKISIAEGYVFNRMNNEALKLLDEIINTSRKNSREFQSALLLKAHVLYQMNRFKDAADLYSKIIESKSDKNILSLAVSGLGYSEENLGNYPQAISSYNNFLDKFPEHFYSPRIYESLARVHELAGSIEQAKQTNEKIITLYPGTTWAKNAHERNQYLSGQAQKVK